MPHSQRARVESVGQIVHDADQLHVLLQGHAVGQALPDDAEPIPPTLGLRHGTRVLAGPIENSARSIAELLLDDPDGLVEHAHDGVDLLLADDERRRDRVHVAAAEQRTKTPRLKASSRILRGDALRRREPLARLLVLHVLDAGHEADAAHVADDRVREQRREAVLQVGPELGAALHQLLALDDLEVGDAGGAAERVPDDRWRRS